MCVLSVSSDLNLMEYVGRSYENDFIDSQYFMRLGNNLEFQKFNG